MLILRMTIDPSVLTDLRNDHPGYLNVKKLKTFLSIKTYPFPIRSDKSLC
jgi:hypothetical protein